MIDGLSQVLDRFNSCSDVSVRVSGQAKVLEVKRGRMTIRVTVPNNVLEFFVDVLDGATVVVQYWWDYEGYDDTPREELAQSMASDINEFVANLLDRDIRFAAVSVKSWIPWRRAATKQTLQWLINGSWEQAAPFP